MKTKKITKAMRAFAARIAAPPNWTRAEIENRWASDANGWHDSDSPGTLSVKLMGPTEGLIFRLEMREEWARGEKLGLRVSYDGTTLFKTDKGWRSFDRTGVESSFSSPYGGELENPADVIARELERVEKWRKADAERIDVPTIGYRIAPATRDEYSTRLKKGLSVTFTPSGFGTGKRYTVRKPRHPYASKADPKLAAFFGVPELWLETFDHD
jgi:hypothetical protein